MMSLSLRRAGLPCARRTLLQAHNIRTTSPIRSLATTNVSMNLLKDLRARSGAPIVECKKALESTGGGDLDQAMDWLRQHGVAKASSKTQGRDASEGLVGIRVAEDGSSAALVKVASETDYAGRSQAFVTLVTHVAGATLEAKETSGSLSEETLLAAKYDSKTVEEALEEAILAIREKLVPAHATRLVADAKGRCVGYVHGKVENSNVAGTAAALVHVVPKGGKEVPQDVLQDAGKRLAMHVVAAKPLYLTPKDVPDSVLEKEREILKEQMADSGKPPDILDKIVNGRLKKFYEGVCLTEQAHMVEEGNPKVSKVLDGLSIDVTRFEYQSVS